MWGSSSDRLIRKIMRRFYYPNKRTSWLYFISYLALQTSFQFLRRSVNIPFSPRIISVSNNLLIRENVRITINKSANLVKQGKQKQDLFLFQVSNSPSMTTCWHKYFFLFFFEKFILYERGRKSRIFSICPQNAYYTLEQLIHGKEKEAKQFPRNVSHCIYEV